MDKQNSPQIVGGTLKQTIISCLKVLDRIMKRKEIIITSMIVADKSENLDQTASPKEVVAKILGIRDITTICQTYILPQLGLDSIMVVEVKDKLQKNFDLHFTLQEIRNLTFAE